MATRLRQVQYHVVVHDGSATGGPGSELFELTGECLNLVWQNVLNLPGNAAFTLLRSSRKLASLEYMDHHIKVWREDRNGIINVFSGKIVQPDHGAHDTVVYCWDYLALYQRVVVEYYLNADKKRYAAKKIGLVMCDADATAYAYDLFGLAKGKTGSPVEFITKGTTQMPRNQAGTLDMKTGKSFGIGNLQNTLKVWFDLAEMAMANTTNTVVFEVAPDDRTDQTNPAQKFNLYRNRQTDRTDYAFTYPGTLADFSYTEGYGQVVNKFYTLIRDSNRAMGVIQYAVEATASLPIGRDNVRLLEGSGAISTLVGITNDTDDVAGQKEAAKRAARQARRVPRFLIAYPRQGYLTPYDGWQLGDNFRCTIIDAGPEASTDQLDKYLKAHSIAAAWSAEGGESLQLFLREQEG